MVNPVEYDIDKSSQIIATPAPQESFRPTLKCMILIILDSYVNITHVVAQTTFIANVVMETWSLSTIRVIKSLKM